MSEQREELYSWSSGVHTAEADAQSGTGEDVWDDRELLEVCLHNMYGLESCINVIYLYIYMIRVIAQMFDDAIRSHRRRGARGAPYARQHQHSSSATSNSTSTTSTSASSSSGSGYVSDKGPLRRGLYAPPPPSSLQPQPPQAATYPSAWTATNTTAQQHVDTATHHSTASYSATATTTTAPPSVPPPPSEQVEAALADMMNAWYQSGYMTGRYYTLLEMQQQQQQQQSSSSSSSGGTSVSMDGAQDGASPSKRPRN